MKTSKEQSFFFFHFFPTDLPQVSRTVPGNGTQSEINNSE